MHLFLFFSSSVMHDSMPLLVYTLIAVIILRYSSRLAIDIRDSTGTVIYALTTSGLGPIKLAISSDGAMRKRHARASCLPGNAAQ